MTVEEKVEAICAKLIPLTNNGTVTWRHGHGDKYFDRLDCHIHGLVISVKADRVKIVRDEGGGLTGEELVDMQAGDSVKNLFAAATLQVDHAHRGLDNLLRELDKL